MRKLKQKTFSRRSKRKESGITLIALVITIIVLLILAGVSIAMLTGQNGILTQANNAKDDTQYAQWVEKIDIAIMGAKIKNKNTTMNDVINELINEGIISDESQVNKETGAITTNEPTYVVKDKLLDYIDLFDEDTLTIGEPINTDKYGWKVTNYTVQTEKMESNIWRLFYQDNKYAYLITDNVVGDYKISEYTGQYKNGSSVSKIGQKLNSMLLEDGTFFVEENSTNNLKATAWLTDPEQWKDYKNNDAAFAIGSPTVELFIASFNATASKNKINTKTLEIDSKGYEHSDLKGFSQNYNYGIYNEGSESYWIASPSAGINGSNFELIVRYNMNIIDSCNFNNNYSWPVRPIVCIPTIVFNSKYYESLVDE